MAADEPGYNASLQPHSVATAYRIIVVASSRFGFHYLELDKGESWNMFLRLLRRDDG